MIYTGYMETMNQISASVLLDILVEKKKSYEKEGLVPTLSILISEVKENIFQELQIKKEQFVNELGVSINDLIEDENGEEYVNREEEDGRITKLYFRK